MATATYITKATKVDETHRGFVRRDRGAVSERRRVPGIALSPAAPRAPLHTTAAPCAVVARAGCDRTPGGARRVAQRAVHRPVACRSPCHVARGAAVPLCPAYDVSRARGGQGSPRAARPGPASGVYRTGTRGDAPESGLVVGHHQTQGARSRTSTTRCTSSSTSSAATRWAGWSRATRMRTWRSA